MKHSVVITSVGAGGDGVGRLSDGRVVFVPRTAPGDEVELEELVLKARYARALPGRLRAAGRERIDPACPHYVGDRCGGCQLQHLSYDAQLQIKRTVVGDALRRIGKLDLPDPPLIEAVEEWRYRAKITLAAGRKKGTLGLHPFDQPGKVFPLEDCHITDPRLIDLWRALQPLAHRLPQPLEHLVLRLDRDAGRHVIAESSGRPWLDAEALRSDLAAQGQPCVLWWKPSEGAARVMAGPATGYPATAFEQVNPDMGGIARRWAVDQLGDVAGALVWDLYGGVGDTAVLLAGRGARVVSVDADEAAVDWARRRTDASSTTVRWIAARVEDVVGSLEAPAAVIVNPPRRGLDPAVTARLAALEQQALPQLAYLSCDPATLARDLARLGPSYRVSRVQAFDLFPQTAHVETVALVEPK